jgi:hypothetical protein
MQNNTKQNKNNDKKTKKQPNPLEALKDISKSAAKDMRSEAANIGTDIVEQLVGINLKSGEIHPGQTIEFGNKSASEKSQKNSPESHILFEKQLIEQERSLIESKTGELKMQLKAIQEQILVVASKTEGLTEEIQVAAMQTTVDPGEYHIIFFEKMLEFINSFKMKVESAAEWLSAVNTRVAKKNKWGANVAKHGAKYMMSGEHYVARSAG